jgi:hypothetical protein
VDGFFVMVYKLAEHLLDERVFLVKECHGLVILKYFLTCNGGF